MKKYVLTWLSALGIGYGYSHTFEYGCPMTIGLFFLLLLINEWVEEIKNNNRA